MQSSNTPSLPLNQALKTPAQLRQWLKDHLQLQFPETGICQGHSSPFDYLKQSYFEPAKDLVVWAPRGGGKTRLGAAATLLDLLHKPNINIRILGGSLEQSLRMWEHLMPDILNLAEEQINGKPGARNLRLLNESAAGVITQSQRAVRGLRVQKLRCDEVDLFDRRVWEAAQLATRSKPTEDPDFPQVSGVVEALSTAHNPGGLMETIIDKANDLGTPVIKWCLMEILQHCPENRVCATCPLYDDCKGRAKEPACDGFFPIDDAIRMKSRVSKETWESEMLCKRASRLGAVFGTFDADIHVTENLPPVPPHTLEKPGVEGLYLGIDFGYKNPFVCLWIRRDSFGRSHVIDEYVKSWDEVDNHIKEIQSRPHGPVRKIGCDPAGTAANEQTGQSNVQKLRRALFKVGCKGSRIQDGLEIIRLGLQSATGQTSLYIHPRCKQLILAMRAYRYGETRSETPNKDGPDHLIDALRYYYINRDSGEVTGKSY